MISDKSEILAYLQELKPLLAKEGLIVVGLFGSYAKDRAREDSDIDILVDATERFVSKYDGFDYFIQLDEIRQRISERFHKKVDIVDKSALGEPGRQTILKGIVYA